MCNNTIYSIYKITNLINEKVYIGFTKKPPEARWKQHIITSKSYKSTYLLHKAIKKYGKEHFKFETIYQSKEADYTENIMEPFFIKRYNSYYLNKRGYNMTVGGHSTNGYKFTKEDIKKISNSSKKLWQNKEHRKRMSEIRKGKTYIKGYKHTEETKKRMSKAQKGRKCSEKLKKILAQNNRDRIWTDESRKKLSEKAKERLKDPTKNPRYGKPCSEETKQKLQYTNSKQWEITFPDQHKETIKNLKMFCQNNNLSYDFFLQKIRKKENYSGFFGIPLFKRKECSEKTRNKIRNSKSKTWKIITPDNNTIIIINLYQYCKENALCHSKMSLVAKNKRLHHKGFKIKKLGNINEIFPTI